MKRGGGRRQGKERRETFVANNKDLMLCARIRSGEVAVILLLGLSLYISKSGYDETNRKNVYVTRSTIVCLLAS